MPAIQVILHPTDFSESSAHAFDVACSLARDYGARLVLFTVVPAFTGPVPAGPAPDPHRPAESQEGIKEGFPWPQVSDPRLAVEHRAAEGDSPELAILSLARALPCDLIVMGTHGRTGLGRLLTGSVAEAVLRQAGCPVLVVKTPLAPSAEKVEPGAQPGQVIDVRPLGSGLQSAKTKVLAAKNGLRISRLVVAAGKEIPEHSSKGALVVHCLEGRVAFTALGRTQDLHPGELLYLPAGAPHSLKGLEPASLLLVSYPDR